MNCQKFESVASELARGQIMEAEAREEALAHTAGCSACAARLRNEEMLTLGLRSLASGMKSFPAPATIEARLLSAFRQPPVAIPLPTTHNHRRYWLAAIAALLLIVFSVVAVRWRVVEAPHQAEVKTPVPEKNALPAEEHVPSREENTADNRKPKRKQQRRSVGPSLQAKVGSARNRDNNVVANHVSNEIATEFMPLGYLNAATLQDGGQIVRVELPRTALANFGLPVNMDRYNEKVKADILLGVDGMAHAIRFVQEKRLQ